MTANIKQLGRIQPQALVPEEGVLGAILLDKDALSVVMDILVPESFYPAKHQIIYKSFLRLFQKSNPVDLITVTEDLKKHGELETVGGPYYLIELTNRVSSAANIEFHARIVAQKYMQRQLITISSKILKDSYEDTTDVFVLIDDSEQAIFNIAQNSLKGFPKQIGSAVMKSLKKVEVASESEDGITGVPSGFTDIDRLTSGWQPSDLIIIAARPGMGKTSLTLSLAKNTAMMFGKGVAIFSLEMSEVQLSDRLLSMESEIQGSAIRSGRLEQHEWQKLHTAAEKISDLPIYIDDTPGIGVMELRAKCRRLKMQHDIQLVIIDYIQLMRGVDDGKKGNREQEVSAISRSLKGLAKDLNVPVIALSQLSRAVETRGGTKRPQLSDLRESGAIEQDADIVSFIYRPEYYQIVEDEEGQSLKGVSEIIIAKHRNGALKTVKLKFIDQYAKFEDMDDPNFSSQLPPSNLIERASRVNDDDIPY